MIAHCGPSFSRHKTQIKPISFRMLCIMCVLTHSRPLSNVCSLFHSAAYSHFTESPYELHKYRPRYHFFVRFSYFHISHYTVHGNTHTYAGPAQLRFYSLCIWFVIIAFIHNIRARTRRAGDEHSTTVRWSTQSCIHNTIIVVFVSHCHFSIAGRMCVRSPNYMIYLPPSFVNHICKWTSTIAYFGVFLGLCACVHVWLDEYVW